MKKTIIFLSRRNLTSLAVLTLSLCFITYSCHLSSQSRLIAKADSARENGFAENADQLLSKLDESLSFGHEYWYSKGEQGMVEGNVNQALHNFEQCSNICSIDDLFITLARLSTMSDQQIEAFTYASRAANMVPSSIRFKVVQMNIHHHFESNLRAKSLAKQVLKEAKQLEDEQLRKEYTKKAVKVLYSY